MIPTRFLTLETGAANRPARSLYQSLGYQEEGIRLAKAIPPYRPGRTQADQDRAEPKGQEDQA